MRTTPSNRQKRNIRDGILANLFLAVVAGPLSLLLHLLYVRGILQRFEVASWLARLAKISVIIAIFSSFAYVGIYIYSSQQQQQHPKQTIEQKNTTTALSDARWVVSSSTVYQKDNGSYPTSPQQLSVGSDILFATRPITDAPYSPHVVAFYVCGDTGNVAGYWDYVEAKTKYIYSGEVATLDDCQLVSK